MKQKTKIIFLVGTTLFIFGSILAGLTWFVAGGNIGIYKTKTGWHKYSDESYTNISETLETFENINIDVSYFNIQFVETESYKLEMKYPDDSDVTWKNEKNTLTITSNSDTETVQNATIEFFNMNNTNYTPKIIISYPRNTFFDAINITNKTGNIKINSLNTQEINCLTQNSNIDLKNIKTNEIETNNQMGYTGMENIQSENLSVNSKNGNIELENVSSSQSQILSNKRGSIDLNNCTTQEIQLTNEMGNIYGENINFNTIIAQNQNGNINLQGHIETACEFSNEKGNVYLEINGIKTDYAIDLSTEIGNIKVDNKNYTNNIQDNNDAPKKVSGFVNMGNINIEFDN